MACTRPWPTRSRLAVALLRMANDIRLLACGPRAGLGELLLPANEPGSSIMPGKVNPTQCEALAMVCTQVIGLDAAVAAAASGGHLQMNVFKPLIGFNLLKAITLLKDACRCFRVNLVEGMEPDRERITALVKSSLMLVTALTPAIGYSRASAIAQQAHRDGVSLRQAALPPVIWMARPSIDWWIRWPWQRLGAEIRPPAPSPGSARRPCGADLPLPPPGNG